MIKSLFRLKCVSFMSCLCYVHCWWYLNGPGQCLLIFQPLIVCYDLQMYPRTQRFQALYLTYCIPSHLTLKSIKVSQMLVPKPGHSVKPALTPPICRLKCPYCPMEQNPSHAKQIYFWSSTLSSWVRISSLGLATFPGPSALAPFSLFLGPRPLVLLL